MKKLKKEEKVVSTEVKVVTSLKLSLKGKKVVLTKQEAEILCLGLMNALNIKTNYVPYFYPYYPTTYWTTTTGSSGSYSVEVSDTADTTGVKISDNNSKEVKISDNNIKISPVYEEIKK